ncbi:MAG: hypothetical protein AAFP69_13475 [Planctomycetota bacterium]
MRETLPEFPRWFFLHVSVAVLLCVGGIACGDDTALREQDSQTVRNVGGARKPTLVIMD